jgi:carnitine monooxygenase subunit
VDMAIAQDRPLHSISDPQRIPVQRYYDADFYRLECERLWPRAWQMACRAEQVANIGDWIEYSNLGKSVIVVRTKDGVKAFHNVCRHRGLQLAEGHGNCKVEGFICPFHGWRWNIDGKNTFVYGKHMFDPKQLNEADLALTPCRAEVAVGCVFINHDNNALSLADTMGPLLQRMEAHNFSKMRAEWWYSTILPANWKTAMEAFMEGYHVMRTHPQLQRAVPVVYNSMYGHDTGNQGPLIDPNMNVRDAVRAQYEHMKLLSTGMAGMVHAKEIEIMGQLLDVELPADPALAIPTWFGIVQDQITKQLQAKGEPVPDLNAVAVSHPVSAVEFLFPHYFVLPLLSNAAAYRIRPVGPESCIFELWSLTFYPEGQEPSPPMEPTVLPYNSEQFPEIPRQDYSNIPRQQKGLHGGGFEFMRLGRDIEGLISNYQRIIDGYLGGVAPDKLVAATQKLVGNFDGKIFEFDF